MINQEPAILKAIRKEQDAHSPLLKDSENLKKIKATSEKLQKAKSTEIKFSAPILKKGEDPILYPRTINVIQGQAGVHKSRLAEYICSALIKKPGCNEELLGFKRTNSSTFHKVIYVDTERNILDQFPLAIQSILKKGGYQIDENPLCFAYVSLLEFERAKRFDVLEEYIKNEKSKSETSLFIVLDVITDCLQDFNKVEDSLKLIDFMNKTINEYDVTFLCLIHENPGSEKARGHVGTELMNKSSTFLKIGFKDNTQVIEVAWKKLRSAQKPLPFYMTFITGEGLKLVSPEDIQLSKANSIQKGKIQDVVEVLESVFYEKDFILKNELEKVFKDQLDISPRTASERIDFIIDEKNPLINRDGAKCLLESRKDGKLKQFYLEPIEIPTQDIDN